MRPMSTEKKREVPEGTAPVEAAPWKFPIASREPRAEVVVEAVGDAAGFAAGFAARVVVAVGDSPSPPPQVESRKRPSSAPL